MAMKITNAGLDIIKKYEGCRLEAYKCPAGVWTIGYGHTKGVKPGMKITVAKADEYLKSDCKASENAVNKYQKKYNFNQNQFDALVSFTFNCGAGNLKTLLDNGNRDIDTISKKIPLYNKAAGKELSGLTKRRNSEKALFDKKVDIYYKKYKGSATQVDAVLKAIGVPSKYYGSWTKRKKVATKNGIKTYVGTAKQNAQIVELAKKGKLKKV